MLHEYHFNPLYGKTEPSAGPRPAPTARSPDSIAAYESTFGSCSGPSVRPRSSLYSVLNKNHVPLHQPTTVLQNGNQLAVSPSETAGVEGDREIDLKTETASPFEISPATLSTQPRAASYRLT